MSTSVAVCDPKPPPFEALGTNCKITVPPPNTDEAEAHLIRLRTTRWRLLEAAGTLLPGSRTAKCRKWKISKKKLQEDGLGSEVPVQNMVSIFRSNEHKSTFYGGLQTCGSVWQCPHCAVKVSERKRIELKDALVEWESRGGKLYMMTLTFPHGPYDKLSDLLSKFSSALADKFYNRKTWRGWKLAAGLRHYINSLEVTHGQNGWHVHSHRLLFIMPGPGLKEPCAEDLLEAWQSACVSVGLGKPNQHGLDIRDGTSAGEYVSKWGFDLELTKSHVKKGRNGHCTPWDLLRDFEETGDCKSGALFKEFARTFKGKRQLVFSRGLRVDLGLGPQKTDKEIAETLEDKVVRLGYLTDAQWHLIVWYKKRGEVLEIARYGDWKDVLDFIAQLRLKNYRDRRIRGPDHNAAKRVEVSL